MIVSVKYFHSYMVFIILYMLSLQVDIALSYESGQWAVEIKGGPEEAKRLINAHGFLYLGQVGELQDIYHIAAYSGYSRAVTAQLDNLKNSNKVGFLEKQNLRFHEKKMYTLPSDPLWEDQWSLHNTELNGNRNDINVQPVWLQGITGKGVTIGIVDDGVEYNHPDLSQNYDENASYDFVGQDSDPSPLETFLYQDSHGTKCAGVIAMQKDNNECGVGVAYDAKIAGLRLITNLGTTDVQEAKALNYKFNDIDIYSNSWGPQDSGFSVEGPQYLTKMALKNGAQKGRNGKGSIYVWAGGNGGFRADSCSADGYINSIYTIAAGAVDDHGIPAYYDEMCSAKMIVTFNHNSSRGKHVTTTTLKKKCYSSFSGTSASTPLVSGVIALVLQANPTLTWRDIQYLLIYTANTKPLMKESNKHLYWTTNGAGLRISPQFGFGAINAEAMVTRARHWTNVPNQVMSEIIPTKINGYAYNKAQYNLQWSLDSSSVEQDIHTHLSDITFLEHVVVKLTLQLAIHEDEPLYNYEDYYNALYNEPTVEGVLNHSNARRGDIRVTLESPQGTVSELLPFRNHDFINTKGYTDWPFLSVHFWGENPVGVWELSVYYRSNVGSVVVSNITVEYYGTQSIPRATSQIPERCSTECSNTCTVTNGVVCDVCKQYRDAVTLECLQECPNNFTTIDNYCVNSSSEFVYSYRKVTSNHLSSSNIISPTTRIINSKTHSDLTSTLLTSNITQIVSTASVSTGTSHSTISSLVISKSNDDYLSTTETPNGDKHKDPSGLNSTGNTIHVKISILYCCIISLIILAVIYNM